MTLTLLGGWFVSVEASSGVMAQVSFQYDEFFQQERALVVQLLDSKMIQVADIGTNQWYDLAVDDNEMDLLLDMAESLLPLNRTTLVIGKLGESGKNCRVPPTVVNADLYIVTAEGEANMILSDDSCWRGLSVYPFDGDLKNTARYLRERLISIGKDSVE